MNIHTYAHKYMLGFTFSYSLTQVVAESAGAVEYADYISAG